MAAARLTKDSIASDSRPTEPVIHQAAVLSPMVSSATTTDTAIRRRGVSQARIAGEFMRAIVAKAGVAAARHPEHPASAAGCCGPTLRA